jgi:hypothetical protein
MEKEISRVHRLALPLIVERRGSILHVSDGMFGHEFEFKDFGRLKVVSIDAEGSITFEISAVQQQALIEPPSPKYRKTSDVGFVLIGSGTAKSSSGSVTRGTYQYFKRPADEYFYAEHKLRTKTKRIHLGSLQDPASHVRQFISAIQRVEPTDWFDRKKLISGLTPSLSHGQKMKSILDIFVIEGYLERRESRRQGKVHEEYKATLKLCALK